MRNEINNILSIYNSILENKKIISLNEIKPITLSQTRYNNVKIDSKASSDSVNKALLDDLQTAASRAGIIVTITTASTGHNTKTSTGSDSRHGQKTAVDIAKINNEDSGGATGPSNGNPRFRDAGNKLKDILVSMRYSLNSERGNDKAVLWQTGVGGNHYNHLHVSNTTDSTTNSSTGNTTTNNTTSDTTSLAPQQIDPNQAYYKANLIDPNQTYYQSSVQREHYNIISEEKIYGSFGNGVSSDGYTLVIPKDKNSKIKSPIDGVIKKQGFSYDCKNKINIEHEINSKKFYLEYCGLKKTKDSGNVFKSEMIGETGDDDITVTLYNSSKERVRIDYYKEKESSDDYKKSSSGGKKSSYKRKPIIDPNTVYYPSNVIDPDAKYYSSREIDPNKVYYPASFKEGYKIQKNIDKIRKLLK
jgi:hypothetical protein